MENESLREPKNTLVIFLLLAVAVVTIWALVASFKANGLRKDVERITSEKEALRVECDQIKQEALVKMNDAEKLRQTAMEWTRQHQVQVQEEMRKKAEEAAKQAKLKEEAAKKPVVAKGKDVPVKKSTTKVSKSGKSAKSAKSTKSSKSSKPAPAKTVAHEPQM